VASPTRSIRRATKITFSVAGGATGGNRSRRNRRSKRGKVNWGGIIFWGIVILVILAAFGGH